jgi:GntR family transcriptional regulator/MocR family aminotransferase
VSSIEQAALADFIATGRMDRHVRQMRTTYRRRRDALVDALGARFALIGVAAGLHVTLRLPAGAPSERELLDRSFEQSISFHPLSAHRLLEADDPGLVIGYGRPPAHAFPAALELLAGFLDGAIRSR